MSTIKIKLVGLPVPKGMREIKLEIEGSTTLGDIIKDLIRIFGEKVGTKTKAGKFELKVIILLNGQPIETLDRMNAKIGAADTIYLVSPIGGG